MYRGVERAGVATTNMYNFSWWNSKGSMGQLINILQIFYLIIRNHILMYTDYSIRNHILMHTDYSIRNLLEIRNH